LNDNTIKGLTSLLSVEQEIMYIEYTWILHNKMYQKFNKKASLMIFHIVLKWRLKLCIVILEDHGNNLVQAKDNNTNRINEMTSMVGYHSIMWEQAYLANGKWDMSWWFWIGLYNGLLCMNKKSWTLD
jgi:hypothetical protein